MLIKEQKKLFYIKDRSLLPAGVFKVKGAFEKGDVVEVYRHKWAY